MIFVSKCIFAIKKIILLKAGKIDIFIFAFLDKVMFIKSNNLKNTFY